MGILNFKPLIFLSPEFQQELIRLSMYVARASEIYEKFSEHSSS